MTDNRFRNADAPFDSVADTIAGQQDGDRFIRGLREIYYDPDALATRLQEIAGDAARLFGFCRALQKQLERNSR